MSARRPPGDSEAARARAVTGRARHPTNAAPRTRHVARSARRCSRTGGSPWMGIINAPQHGEVPGRVDVSPLGPQDDGAFGKEGGRHVYEAQISCDRTSPPESCLSLGKRAEPIGHGGSAAYSRPRPPTQGGIGSTAGQAASGLLVFAKSAAVQKSLEGHVCPPRSRKRLPGSRRGQPRADDGVMRRTLFFRSRIFPRAGPLQG